MAPSSHVIKWLVSSYRRVLGKQRVNEARQESGAYLMATAAAEKHARRVETLEPRIMLSTDQLRDLAQPYTDDPFLTSGIRSALVAGLNGVGAAFETLSGSGAFSTDVPGVLEYDQDFIDTLFGTFQPPKAKNLADLLGEVGGDTLKELIEDEIAGHVQGVSLGSVLCDLEFSDSGSIGLFDPVDYSVSISNVELVHNSGSSYTLTFDVDLSISETDDDGIYFDLGRNADQFGIRPTIQNAYFPSFSNEIEVEAGFSAEFKAGLNLTITEGYLV